MNWSASRPRAGTALPALLLLAGIALLAMLAWSLLRRDGERPLPETARTAPSEPVPATSRAPPSEEKAGSPADGSGKTVTRADEPPLFDLPDEASVAALEQTGRALFFGLVSDFAGEPCPDALLFHDGTLVGRSDAQGCYRVEVVQESWNWRSRSDPKHHLVAFKEGVGSGGMVCDGLSRRIDLALSWRGRFGGRAIAHASGEPVPGAKIECLSYFGPSSRRRDSLFQRETVATADGRFEFNGLAPGVVELRAQAPGFASNDWTPFEIPETGDRADVAFPLEAVSTVRGRFDPWPPDSLDVRDARVVGFAGKGRGDGPENESLFAPLDGDGLFTLQLARCNGLGLLLEVAGNVLWRHRVEFGREPQEIDLGKIELPRPATVTGHVTLPANVLELGFEFEAEITGARRHFRAPIGVDGNFHLGMLPPGPAMISVVLGRQVVIGFEEHLIFRKPRELLAGQTLDLGEVALVGTLFCGRVVDAKGASVGLSRVSATYAVALESDQNEEFLKDVLDVVTTDEQGRYAFLLLGPRLLDLEAQARVLTEQPPSLLAVARGMISEPRSVKFPGLGVAVRVDLRLGRGRALRGVVRDDHGQPIPGCTVSAYWTHAIDEKTSREQQRTVTRANGAFEMTGLADGEVFIALDEGNGSGPALGPFALSDTPLELVLSRNP